MVYPLFPVFNSTNLTLTKVLVYGNTVTNNWFGNLFLISLWFLIFLVTMTYRKIDGALVASALTLLIGGLASMAGGFVSQEMVLLNLALFLLILVFKAFEQ